MAAPLLFFGDGSLPLHPAYSRILQSRTDDSLLSLFLSRARLALQHEISRIPLSDRRGLPDLAELESLIPEAGDSRPDHQCLAPAMLVIIQLGQFISWYEARPEEPYPDSSSAITVGLCVGQLSALAVSLARSLTELLPLAVDSVRLAFRTGFTAVTVRDELEQQFAPDESWAMTVAKGVGMVDDGLLETIQRETGILTRKKAYVSAVFRGALTLQGPPSTLDKVGGWLNVNQKVSPKSFWKRLPIYTPYHAPHLYSEMEITRIRDFSGPSSNSTYHDSCSTNSKPRLLSPVTGRYYPESSRRALLTNVLFDVLKAPINWSNVTAGCAEYVAATQRPSWVVRAYGPTLAAGSLVSALKNDSKVEAVLDDFCASSSPSQAGVKTKEPIAIIGMAGRFPDAMSHDELWKLLESGVDCHKVIPIDRFDPDVYVAKDGRAKNPTGTPYGCFMKKPGMFDARFFNLSPREAEQTDPQQRLALATAYEALEMSGFVPNRTPSTRLERIGTYYGQTGDDYREFNASQDIQTYYISGNDRAFGPGRINHHFKFGGPSMSVDTACSSSAVALNVACTALWAKDCDTALVGGMTLLGSSDTFCGLSRGHFLNDTGNCKTFDDKADGYCRGEAVATVVVKRLSDAQADNDNILAIILAAGTNYSAASASITHPHGPTQEVLYKRLLNQAGLHPFDVDYVEMHGTGTQAGDAAEMSSVSNVFAPASPGRPQEQPLWLSAVKANVGHGESASGITALIKSLLVLREQKMPPHVGIKSGVINRTFPDLEQRNIKIALSSTESFPCKQERKRRFLVNNFGAAGGNTAVLLEEGPAKPPGDVIDTRPEHIINVSAKTTASFKNNVQSLLRYLEKEPTTNISNLAYTTTARRMHFPLRLSVMASSITVLKDRLTTALADETCKAANKAPKLIFAFTGQGSLYLSLAKELFESSQQFRSDIIRFNQICLDQGFPTFLLVVEGKAGLLDDLRPVQTQLAITAVQMGLYRLWTSWGVTPTAVVGHSLGEYAALFACGVLSANDTLFLVGQRAMILEVSCTKKTHCMLSVRADLSALRQHLGDMMEDLEVACINGPEDTVLSGRVEVAQTAQDQLRSHGLKCCILNTPYAFHSAQIDPILDEFEEVAQKVKFMTPKTPLLSPLLGTVMREVGVLCPKYLRRHAREAVNFVAALHEAQSQNLASKDAVWLELGPSPICLGMVKATLGDHARGMPCLRKNENAWTTSSKALCFLYNAGLDVNWNEYHRDFERSQNVLHIPAYSFDEKNYWISYKNDWALTKGEGIVEKVSEVRVESAITTTVQRLVTKDVSEAKASFTFETDLSEPALHAIIAGHSLNGLALCPAGVYADMALTVADYIRRECKLQIPATGINVADMEILGAVTVPVPRMATPQLLRVNAVADLNDGTVQLDFGTFSAQTKKTTANAKCRVEYGNDKTWLQHWSRNAYLVQKRINDLERGVNEGTTDKMFKRMAYQLFSQLVVYGSKYQGMQEVLVNAEELEATATLKLHEGTDVGDFFASPLWIDNLAQLSGFVMNAIGVLDPRVGVYISHGWGSLQIALPMDPTKPYKVHVKMQPLDGSMMAGNVSIFQDDTMVGLLGDVKFQKVPRSLLDTMLTPSSSRKPSATPMAEAPIVTKLRKIEPEMRSPPAPSRKLSSASESPFTNVLKVIAEEVGIDVSDLSDESDLCEVGVDSLMSLTILSSIRESLHIELPSSVFSDCSTIGDLRRLLSSNTSTSDDESDFSIETPTESGVQTPEVVYEPTVGVKGDMLDTLHTTIADEIGVSIEELLATDDLSALGVDSLMSLSIIAALREKLGVDIPPDAIAESFSLQGIKDALNIAPARTLPEQQKASTPRPNVNGAAKPPAKSMLLQGNPQTASRTIFLFPDGSGSASSYAELPTIASDACVFAINSPFLTCPEKYTCTLEEAAELMVNEVRTRQPHGPYILAGWSAGGMYAYEAVRQLLDAGEPIDRLILIDSPCRLDYGPMPADVLEYVSRSGVIGGKGRGSAGAPKWLVEHFQATIHAIRAYMPRALGTQQSPPTFVVWAAKGVFEDWPRAELAGLDLSDAVAAWLLKPKADPGSQGWEKLLDAEKMMCATVDGNHFSMVHPPNCASLRRAIADAVEVDVAKRTERWSSA